MSSFHLEPRYGKQTVPVFKIQRQNAKHDVVDMVIQIMLEGDVADSWLTGENHQILPTETQKNTCYAIALKTDFASVEEYGKALGNHILRNNQHITTVTIDIDERTWQRLTVNGKPHNHAFTAAKEPILRTAHLVVARSGAVVTSGIKDIKVMKTTQSGFKGYIVDQYTNLQPVGEGTSTPFRIMCTQMEANWTYNSTPRRGYSETNELVKTLLLDVFAGNPDTGVFSKSLQETCYNMGCEALRQYPELEGVHMITPNVHFYNYPLKDFGMDNPNVVFQSTDPSSTASGRIETRVSRSGAVKARL